MGVADGVVHSTASETEVEAAPGYYNILLFFCRCHDSPNSEVEKFEIWDLGFEFSMLEFGCISRPPGDPEKGERKNLHL